MLSILRKTRGSMARSGGSSPADRYGVVDDDLTAWEIINASQSDDEDLFSFDGEDDDTSDEDDVIRDVPESKPEDEEVEDDARDLGTLDVVMAIQSLSVSPPMMFPVEVTRVRMYRDDRSEHDDYDVHHDDDDMDDDDDDGVDDELVTWKLKGRFGKQGIKKLGKRGGSKPNKSKRMPYYYKAAGCV